MLRENENTQRAEESFLELVDRAGSGGVPQSPAFRDFAARRFSDRLVFEDDAELRAYLRWALARRASGDGKPDHE